MLVSHSLAIHSDAFNGENLVLLTEPAAIELIIRNDPQEKNTNGSRQQARYEEDDLPRFKYGPVLPSTDGNTVGD